MSNTSKNGWIIIIIAFLFTVGLMNSGLALGEQFKTIKDGVEDSLKNTKTLVIVLSGKNCSWCVKQKFELKGVTDFNYVVVNHRDHPNLMKNNSSSIPQLIIITHTSSGKWIHKSYVGYKNKQEIRKRIKWQQNLS